MNVLITGCSSGIGLVTAVTFARRGHRVIAGLRSLSRRDALSTAARDAGVEIDMIELDVTSAVSVDRAVESVLASCGSIDALVNNAGIELFGAVHLATDDEVAAQFDTNVYGVVRTCRAVVPSMWDRGSGVIVNVGSIAGRVGVPYSGLYAASKHALVAITEAMHFELSQRGIRLAIVEPGSFATQLTQNAVTVAAMPPGSVHHERFLAFRAARRHLSAGGDADVQPDVQLVADAIYEAATTDRPRLRWLVGADAELIAATKGSMDFEDFEVAVRAILDWND